MSDTSKKPRPDRYACLRCGWTYRPSRGCPEANLLPGADFAEVNETFTCPKCGGPLRDFAVKERPE